MEKAFAICNKQGEILVFTVDRSEDISVRRFADMKDQAWPELQAGGYRVITVTIQADNIGPWDK